MTALLFLLLVAPGQAEKAPTGVVVEKVEPEAAAARAGLEPGDILMG